MTDFTALLLRSLPGIYRQKDTDSQLARFLEIMASPLAETETSISQLYEDLSGATARAEFLPLIGALIGAEIDTAQPTSLQRAALEDTLPFFRSKGLAEPLARTVEAFTGWPTVAVDYSQVVARTPHVESLIAGAAPLAPQTFDLRDSQHVARLGRSDDPAPYTIDLRTPAGSSNRRDRTGRTHFDNHGFFVTVARSFDNRRPNLLRTGAPAAFSFDDHPLAPDDDVGMVQQLLDGIDGSPITVAELAGHEADYVDTPRGFTIRARGISVLDPSFGGARVVAARLANLASPRDPGGAPLALQPRDIAVDPQLGRFLLDIAALGVRAADLRVGYRMASVSQTAGATPVPLGPATSNTYAFAADGRVAPLRDAVDGTLVTTKLHLGGLISDYHGRPRGYSVRAGAVDLTAILQPTLAAIESAVTAAAGTMVIDLDRGRFAVPAGVVPDGVLSVDYSAADEDAERRTFDRLAQRLPRLVPAGVVSRVIDTRRSFVDTSHLTLTAKTTIP